METFNTQNHAQAVENRILGVTAIIGFLGLFYNVKGFAFGYYNNIEELPLILRLINPSLYVGDPFVNSSLSVPEQSWPYIYAISWISKLLPNVDLKTIFFAGHIMTIAGIYAGLRRIAFSMVANEMLVFSIIAALFLLLQPLSLLTNERWLFASFLDPELISFPFLFFAVAGWIEERKRSVLLNILIANIIHPLYSILLLSAFVISAAIETVTAVLRHRPKPITRFYLLLAAVAVTLPYPAYLAIVGGEKGHLADVAWQMVVNIRAPHHMVLSTLSAFRSDDLAFFISVLSMVLAGTIIHQMVSKLGPVGWYRYSQQRAFHFLSLLTISGLLVMATSSIIYSCIKIPLIVSLTPYRICVVIGPIAFILAVAPLLGPFAQSINSIIYRFRLILVILPLSVLLFWTGMISATEGGDDVSRLESNPTTELLTWIDMNTDHSECFLDYVNIDLRTMAQRPVYFVFKTVPQKSLDRENWTRRFLSVFDFTSDDILHSPDMVSAYFSAFMNGNHRVPMRLNIGRVLENIKKVVSSDPLTCVPKKMVFYRNQLPFIENINSQKIVYENSEFVVFDITP